MDSEAAETPAAPVIRRGRKPSLSPIDKIAALEAQLAAAKTEARQAEKERNAIVGSVIIAAMKDNPDFKRAVIEQLRAKVTSPRDKASIAELLI